MKPAIARPTMLRRPRVSPSHSSDAAPHTTAPSDASSPIASHYFPPSLVQSLGLTVLGCGHLFKDSSAFDMHDRLLGHYALIFWVKGRGWFESAPSGRIAVGGGDLCVLFPEVRQGYGPAANGFLDEYWVILDGPFMAHAREALSSPQRPIVRVGDAPDLVAIFREMVACGADIANAAHRRTIGRLAIDALSLVEGARLDASSGSAVHSWVREAIQLVQRDPVRAWNFHEMALRFCVSYSLFRKRFALATGFAPNQFLIRERMFRASQMLANGALVKEAALGVGMDDVYYFSRLFKAMTGTSPSAFAQRAGEWSIWAGVHLRTD